MHIYISFELFKIISIMVIIYAASTDQKITIKFSPVAPMGADQMEGAWGPLGL